MVCSHIGCQHKHCIYYIRHRLTTIICDAIFDWGCDPPVWGKSGRRALEMGPLSSQVANSYRLSIVAIAIAISHRFRSAPTCHGQTDEFER